MKQFGTKGKNLPGTAPNPAGKRTLVSTDGKKHYVQVQRTPANFKPKGNAAATSESDKTQKTQSRPRGARVFVNAGLIFCAIIVITLLVFYAEKVIVDATYDKLFEEVENAEQMASKPDQDTIPEEPTETTPETSAPEDPTEAPTDSPEDIFDKDKILARYQSLYSKNNELFGWIQIENTRVNYPVMHSTDDNDEYLHRDFYGNYFYAGIPFADIKCDRGSDNILIYGHNMKNGTMFRDILKYKDKSYWEKNRTFMFSDLTEEYTYEILAVFYDRIYKKSENVFKFYQFIDAEDKEDFDYAISQFKQKSIYDTGVSAQYGDKLVTLVTCAYHVDDGRFVIVARRK